MRTKSSSLVARCLASIVVALSGCGGQSSASNAPNSTLYSVSVLAVAVGDKGTCVVLDDGAAVCWGSELQLERCNGNLLRDEPGKHYQLTLQGEKAASVSVGHEVSCVLTRSGRVGCFGENQVGLLGQEAKLDLSDTTRCLNYIDLGGPASQVKVGALHVCALMVEGSVKCWGSNEHGAIGLGREGIIGNDAGQMGSALRPVDLGTSSRAKSLSSNNASNCVVFDDRSVRCWGDNLSGELGESGVEARGDEFAEMGVGLRPIRTSLGIVDVQVGGRFACSLASDHGVRCWGENAYGALALNEIGSRKIRSWESLESIQPIELGADFVPNLISVGGHSVCAISTTGILKCWGGNRFGQLGLGDTRARGLKASDMGEFLPAVELGEAAKDVSIGIRHACAILSSGNLKCWGNNEHGQLGIVRASSENVGDSPGEMGHDLPSVLFRRRQ